MSALAVFFALLGFLFSLKGVLLVGVGVLLFLLSPLISLVTPITAFSRLFLWLGSQPLRRAAVVISEHNDALFKPMRFLGLGVESITIDGEEKLFEDPDSALHYWNGIKFALADEEHGVLFDPRHAAVGMRKRMKDHYDEAEYLATTDEWEHFGIRKWLPGVFAMPKVHELVDLSAVQALIDGGERSEYAQRVEELYKHSQDPFSSGTSAIKFLYPILAFAITFGGIWVLAIQFGTPQATDSVSFGVLALIPALKQMRTDIDWRTVGWVLLLTLTPLAIVAGMILLFGSILTFFMLIAVSIGFAFLPLLTVLARPLAKWLGLHGLWMRLGFLSYRKPVFEWTPEKYVVREFDQLDHEGGVEWYGLFGTVVGFTYDPSPESWGAEPVPHAHLENQQPLTDGGETMDTNLPKKYERSDAFKRDGYGGYVPRRLDDSKYYINTGIAMNRFANTAMGQKSLNKLLEAKQEHGGGDDGLPDGTVFKATLFAGLLGALSGIALFILPAFL